MTAICRACGKAWNPAYQWKRHCDPDLQESLWKNERTGYLHYFHQGSGRQQSRLFQIGKWLRCANAAGNTGLWTDCRRDHSGHTTGFQPYFSHLLRELPVPLPAVQSGTPHGRLPEIYERVRWPCRSCRLWRTLQPAVRKPDHDLRCIWIVCLQKKRRFYVLIK